MPEPTDFSLLLDELSDWQRSRVAPDPMPLTKALAPMIDGQPMRQLSLATSRRYLAAASANVAALQRGAVRYEAAMAPLWQSRRRARIDETLAKALAAVRAGTITAAQAAVIEMRVHQLRAATR